MSLWSGIKHVAGFVPYTAQATQNFLSTTHTTIGKIGNLCGELTNPQAVRASAQTAFLEKPPEVFYQLQKTLRGLLDSSEKCEEVILPPEEEWTKQLPDISDEERQTVEGMRRFFNANPQTTLEQWVWVDFTPAFLDSCRILLNNEALHELFSLFTRILTGESAFTFEEIQRAASLLAQDDTQQPMREAWSFFERWRDDLEALAAKRAQLEAFAQLTDKVIASHEGVVVQGIHMLEQSAKTFFQECNATAHDHLLQAKVCVEKLQISDNTDLRKGLHTALQAVRENAEEVFQKHPLENEERETLVRLEAGVQRASKEALSALLKSAHVVLKRHCTLQNGPVAQAATVFAETLQGNLKPILQEVKNLPEKMRLPHLLADNVNSLLGRTSPPNVTHSSDTSSSEGGTLDGFLTNAQSMLRGLLDKGVSLLSNKALSGLGLGLLYVLQAAEEKLQGQEGFEEQKRTVQRVIDTLAARDAQGKITGVKESIQVETLYKSVEQALTLLNNTKIYVGGFLLPKLGTLSAPIQNPESLFQENISSLSRARHEKASLEKPDEAMPWKLLAKQEKQRFVCNTTHFLVLKMLYQGVCDLKPEEGDQLYYQWIQAADFDDEKLKTVLFRALDAAQVNLFKRTRARIYYFFYSKVFKSFLQKLCNSYFEEFFAYIEKQKKEGFADLKNMLIHNFTRYLTILGGAFERIAHDSHPTGTLEDMLQIELAKPESNLAFTPEKLYANFAQITIEKCTSNSLVGWLFKKFIGDEAEIVQRLLNKGVNSIQDVNGYTHAFNCVLVKQLKKIHAAMLDKKTSKGQRKKSSFLQEEMLSPSRKKELTGLVKNLLEVLQKYKADTKAELTAVVDGNSFKANCTQAIDGLFIEDVIDNLTQVLSVTIGSLIKEEQLQKLVYHFFQMVNRIYTEEKPFTQAEIVKKAQKLNDVAANILNVALHNAVEEKIDFTGVKQEAEKNEFLKTLKTATESLITTTQQSLGELQGCENLTREEVSNKTRLLLETANLYQHTGFQSSCKARSSSLSSHHKQELKALYLGAAQQSQPLVQALTDLQHAENRVAEFHLLQPLLRQISKKTEEIRQAFEAAPLALEPIAELIRAVEKHVAQFPTSEQARQLRDQIKIHVRALAYILTECKKQQAMIAFCEKERASQSLLGKFVAERQQTLGTLRDPESLKIKGEELLAEINSLTDAPLKVSLKAELSKIKRASCQEAISTASINYRKLLLSAQTRATEKLLNHSHQKETFALLEKIKEAEIQLLKPENLSQQEEKMNRAIQKAETALGAISDWKGTALKPDAFISLSPIDMEVFKNQTTEFVFKRVQEKVNGLLEFARRKETHIGLAHHCILLPYVTQK